MGMTGSQFATIGPKMMNECKRRKYNGSLESYVTGWSPSKPTSGELIYAAQGKIVIEPLLKIKQFGNLAIPSTGSAIPSDFDNEKITNWINALSNESVQGASSCTGACTGLCISKCDTACSGCSGSCSGSCSGCSGTCSGCNGCKDACDGCIGCTQSCGSVCVGGGSCLKSCSAQCHSECRGCGNCVGCLSSCKGGAKRNTT